MYFACIKKKNVILTLIIVCAVALSACLGGVYVNSIISANANRQTPIYNVALPEKKISISFDCAWGVDYTDSLLTTMQEENVRCTFFTVEFWAKKYPDYVKKIFDMGHEIGTHSATHPYMSKLNKNAIVKELTTSCKVIEDIIKVKPTLFRPPYGDYNNLLLQTAKELGLYTIQWDVDSLDWKNLTKSEITKRVLDRVKSGSIVLFHNQGLHTHEALKEIIVKLKEQGYTFVPIGELIYKDNYYINSNGTQVKNS